MCESRCFLLSSFSVRPSIPNGKLTASFVILVFFVPQHPHLPVPLRLLAWRQPRIALLFSGSRCFAFAQQQARFISGATRLRV